MATILETSRLILREFAPEDADALARVICDREAMRFYPIPFERSDADEWITRNRHRYEEFGYGRLFGTKVPSVISEPSHFLRQRFESNAGRPEL